MPPPRQTSRPGRLEGGARLNPARRWNQPASRKGGMGMYIGSGVLALIIIILLLIWLF
jgi:hypothetical protein